MKNQNESKKSLEEYVSEFGTLLDGVVESRKKLCKNYADAVEAYGLEAAEKAYGEAYPPIAPMLPYMLMVGRGEANVGVTSLGFEDIRRNLSGLDMKIQNDVFKNGVEIYDRRTDSVKKIAPQEVGRDTWKIAFDATNKKFRDPAEQKAFVKTKNEKKAAQSKIDRKNKKILYENGNVIIPKAMPIPAIKIVEIMLHCILEFPELKLGEFIRVDVKKFKAAKLGLKK